MRLGPGAMVAAAFIGPGTVTTAATAGAMTGAGLLWAVVFSIVATLILQELAIRSALVTQRDLGELIRSLGAEQWWGKLLIGLIILAIGVGNAAYQSGNLTGAGLGLEAALGFPLEVVIGFSAGIAALLIYIDRYTLIEHILVGLVALMALMFCGLAIWLLPDFFAQPTSRLLPTISTQHLTLILALIGTTVVPYNLFLHATAVRKRWHGIELTNALQEARQESHVSIVIGGIITAAIVVVATATMNSQTEGSIIQSLVSVIDQKLPGAGAIFVGIGLFGAGITSSLTAPLAAGWAVTGALNGNNQHYSKWIALLVLGIGALFALVTTRPTALIISAQATNALLLPIIAVTLLMVANSHLLGQYRNQGRQNLVAVGIVLVVSLLALRKLLALF